MASTACTARHVRVTVAWSLQAGEAHESLVVLPVGATLRDALDAVGLLPSCASGQLQCGVWGRAVEVDAQVRDGDRVEAVRALRVDPKEARRMRFATQGRRSAGLFARRR